MILPKGHIIAVEVSPTKTLPLRIPNPSPLHLNFSRVLSLLNISNQATRNPIPHPTLRLIRALVPSLRLLSYETTRTLRANHHLLLYAFQRHLRAQYPNQTEFLLPKTIHYFLLLPNRNPSLRFERLSQFTPMLAPRRRSLVLPRPLTPYLLLHLCPLRFPKFHPFPPLPRWERPISSL